MRLPLISEVESFVKTLDQHPTGALCLIILVALIVIGRVAFHLVQRRSA